MLTCTAHDRSVLRFFVMSEDHFAWNLTVIIIRTLRRNTHHSTPYTDICPQMFKRHEGNKGGVTVHEQSTANAAPERLSVNKVVYL